MQQTSRKKLKTLNWFQYIRFPPLFFFLKMLFSSIALKKTYYRHFQTSSLRIYLLLNILPIWCHHPEDMLKPENLDIVSFLCCYLCAQCVSKQPYSEASVLLLHACSVGFDFSQPCCPWGSPGKSPGVGCISYSRGSSWPRARTHSSRVSCIGRRILYYSATWEALSVDNFS